jgi:alpha-tubulin suppressor-like RCC1 family protein
MAPLTRRQAVFAIAALPFAATAAAAQTRPGSRHRVILGNGTGILLAPDGALHMWIRQRSEEDAARSSLGQSDNQPVTAFTLVAVPDLSNVVAASAGFNCTFAVLKDGRLLAWGKNPNGRLGTTTQAQMETLASWSPNESNVPIPLSTKFDAIDVSAGNDHALALARDGSVYAWGGGKDGQLGIGPMPVINFRTKTPAAMTYMPVPVRVPNLSDVTAISAGMNQSLALLKDGTVRAWGYNKNGEVGDGTTTNRDRPIPVPGVRDAVAIAACGMFSMALLANGTVMVWGARGFNDKPAGGTMPAVLPGLRGIKAIAGGLAYGVALTESGTVMTWGDNAHAQLGRGWNVPETPGTIKELTDVQSIAARIEFSTAVLASGRIMAWGIVGQAGGRSPQSARSPVPLLVDGLENS